jgi:hypothetical protein
LEQLVPGFMKDTPEDPIDGRMLRLKQTAAGYMIYSVGLDETDDGGTEFDPTTSRPARDIAFFVER